MPIDSGATAWILASTALVMIMTPGVGLFYGGLVRKKNFIDMMTEGRQVFRGIPDQRITICSLMPEFLHDPWHRSGPTTGTVRVQSCLPQVK